MDLSVSYVGIHRHRGADPDSDKDTSGWYSIYIVLQQGMLGSIDIKIGFRITHFLSRADPDYSFVIKPNPGQDQTCRWRRIQYILVKSVLVVQWDV